MGSQDVVFTLLFLICLQVPSLTLRWFDLCLSMVKKVFYFLFLGSLGTLKKISPRLLQERNRFTLVLSGTSEISVSDVYHDGSPYLRYSSLVGGRDITLLLSSRRTPFDRDTFTNGKTI